MTRSPIVLIDKLKRAGLTNLDIARRASLHDATIRRISSGQRQSELPDAAIARLQQLAAEVCPPAGMR